MFFGYDNILGGVNEEDDDVGPLNLSELQQYSRKRESALSGSISRVTGGIGDYNTSQKRQNSMM
jgi:hypothetical protein